MQILDRHVPVMQDCGKPSYQQSELCLALFGVNKSVNKPPYHKMFDITMLK